MSWWRDDAAAIMKGEVRLRKEDEDKRWEKSVNNGQTFCNQLSEAAQMCSSLTDRESQHSEHAIEAQQTSMDAEPAHNHLTSSAQGSFSFSGWIVKNIRRLLHIDKDPERYDAFLTAQNITIHPKGDMSWSTSVKHEGDAERWSSAIRKLIEGQEKLPRPTDMRRLWQNRVDLPRLVLVKLELSLSLLPLVCNRAGSITMGFLGDG
eukprot:752602-Hanusia_phi.AAC.1